MRFTFEPDGNIVLHQVRLHPRTGSSTTIGSRIKFAMIGDLHPGLNRQFVLSKSIKHRRTCCCRSDFDSFFSFSGGCFSLAGNFQFPGNRREV